MHNVILFSHKKNDILSLAVKWMELKSIMLSEVSQVPKDKTHMYVEDRCKYKYKHHMYIYMYTHTNTHIETNIQNVFSTVGLLEETRGRREKGNDKE
jgi:hypothetical protein